MLAARPPRGAGAMRTASFFHRQMLLASAAILAIVLAAVGTTVALAYRSFEQSVGPQALAKARAAGRSLSGTLSLAAQHDLALDKLVGVEDLFAGTARRYPELARIELRSAARRRSFPTARPSRAPWWRGFRSPATRPSAPTSP
jgi:hypothetical protein